MHKSEIWKETCSTTSISLSLSMDSPLPRITDSQNTLSWKGPSGIIESSSWPCTRHANNPMLCLRVLSKQSWSSGSVTIPWGTVLVPDYPLDEESFYNIRSEPSLTQLQPFPGVLSLVREQRSVPNHALAGLPGALSWESPPLTQQCCSGAPAQLTADVGFLCHHKQRAEMSQGRQDCLSQQ